MPTNPMFGAKQSASNKTAPTNPLNDKKSSIYQGRNTFDYSRPAYLTARYADITPFECIHGVEGDVLELGNKHSLRSHTLKSPMFSNVFIKKTYTMTDMKAILPRNWNRFYVNPTVGDDVVASDVNTICKNFFQLFNDAASDLVDFIGSSIETPNEERAFNSLMHALIVFESIFSSGSLLPLLGCHSNATLKSNFDDLFETLISTINGYTYTLSYSDYDISNSTSLIKELSVNSRNFRDFLSFVRSHHNWYIKLSSPTDVYPVILQAFSDFFSNIKVHTLDEKFTPLNYAPLVAYQMSVASFYSRDSVDNVYSAETYRDIMDALWQTTATDRNTLFTFYYSYNGNRFMYDAFSGIVFRYMLNLLLSYDLKSYSASSAWLNSAYAYYYFMNIFGFGQNLRYGDYFTGSKPTPLAVGDVTAEVGADGVNAIDMTVAIARARFLHDNNSIGRRPEDYIDDLLDGQLPPEITEPRRLVTITSSVSGFEVENTAEDQGNIVTLLRSADSNKVYSVAVGHPCIILGLVTFEIQRVYTRTIDRFFLHEDRFDMFNKYLQKIGDQPIFAGELDAAYDVDLSIGQPFSYTLRNMEYKQRYPIACGGFNGFLPGYLFVTDADNIFNDDTYPHIDSDYLRSRNSEMDAFYSSLTNYSLAGYFHFIIGFKNICIAHRKMDYQPSIF